MRASHLNAEKPSTIRQIVSFITCSAFLFSIIISPAEATSFNASNANPAESALVKQFTPPSELGSIVDAHVSDANASPSQPLVIHIQDLHANYGVQSNIAKLLEFLDSRLGAGNYKVAIEGAEGPLTVAELGKIKDKDFKIKVCDRLMKEAELTGSEYFSIVNGKTDVLWGVENERYHQSNIALFQKTYEGKQEIVQNLGKIETDLGPIKAKYYDRAMRKLDEKESNLSAGKISTAEYLRFLVHIASKHGVNIAGDYPEIAKQTGFAPSDKFVNVDKVLTEKQALAAEVRQLLAKNDVQRNLAQVEKELSLFKRFMNEQVTTQEVRDMAPRLAEISGHIQVLLDSTHANYDKKNLSELVSAGLDYYVLALARDKFLTENTLKLMNTSKSPLKAVVLVAGGFHTQGISKLLKDKGVSYITLTPNVAEHTDRDQKLYVARLMDQHADPKAFNLTSAQMLSPFLNGGMAGYVARVFKQLIGAQIGNEGDSSLIDAVVSKSPWPEISIFGPGDLPPTLLPEAGVTRDVQDAINRSLLKKFPKPSLDEASAKRVTVSVFSYNIGHLFGRDTFTLPDEVIEAAKNVLEAYKSTGEIKDYVVYGFGQDLHVQINTYGLGTQNPRIQSLGMEAALAAVNAAASHGYPAKVNGKDFSALSLHEKTKALNIRPVELPFTERGAEPIFISKAINGGMAFFNRALVNLFASENVSGPRLEGAGVVFMVENIADIRAGKSDRRVYVFGDRPIWNEVDFVRTNGQKPMHVKSSQVGSFNEMSVLIGDPTAWVITGVYPARGRMAESKVTLVEPIAVVGVDRVFTDGNKNIPISPVLMVRQQGGAPSIGESHMATSRFYFGIGGEDEGYYTGLLPVTLEQGRSLPQHEKVTKVVGYHFQSSRNGEIPTTPFDQGHVKAGEQDIYDQMAADVQETTRVQKAAVELIQAAAEVNNMVPFMTTEKAEADMAPVREKLKDAFTAVPDMKKGEKDPRIEEANKLSKGRTLSDIKADAGGKVGHTVVPSYFIPIANASLQVAKDKGLIDDFKVFYAGDDLHLLMSHRHGIDSQIVHTLAWETFMRIIWVAQTFGDKWYGLGQDFPNMRNRPIHQDANLNDGFMAELRKHLPDHQLHKWAILEHAYLNQTPVTGESPFSGNVQGQGPGFAEINVPAEGPAVFGIFAADKAGPDAFNVPLRHALDKAIADGSLEKQYGGVEAEVWDIHHAQRATLDYGNQTADVHTLLAPTHLNSVKRVWQAGSARILASLSVEKLGIIAGGEYIGKDDPVLIAVPEIINGFFQFARDHFYMTQGNARGSHNAAPKPRSTRDGIATVNSKPVQLGLMVQISASNGLVVKDMFDDPTFGHAYDRVDKINQAVWDAQGLSGGLVSVPPAQVEGNYPLLKMLKQITAADSPYASQVDMTLDNTYRLATGETPAANRPIRSLVALFGMVVLGATFSWVFLIGAVYFGLGLGSGLKQTNGSLTSAAALSSELEKASPLLMGEEFMHRQLARIPIIGPVLAGTTNSRVWNETAGELFPMLLAPIGLLIGLVQFILLGQTTPKQINVELAKGIETLGHMRHDAFVMALTLSNTVRDILRRRGYSDREIDDLMAKKSQLAVALSA